MKPNRFTVSRYDLPDGLAGGLAHREQGAAWLTALDARVAAQGFVVDTQWRWADAAAKNGSAGGAGGTGGAGAGPLVFVFGTTEFRALSDPLWTFQSRSATMDAAATAGAGSKYFVTDSNTDAFYSTFAGGGAFGVPVFSDGTNWRVG